MSGPMELGCTWVSVAVDAKRESRLHRMSCNDGYDRTPLLLL